MKHKLSKYSLILLFALLGLTAFAVVDNPFYPAANAFSAPTLSSPNGQTASSHAGSNSNGPTGLSTTSNTPSLWAQTTGQSSGAPGTHSGDDWGHSSQHLVNGTSVLPHPVDE